jgi:hypothetical protein
VSEEKFTERAYTWTVRTLYVVGVGLNLVWLYQNFKDTPEGEKAIENSKRYVRRVIHPVKVWRDFQASRPRVMNAAEVTLRLADEKGNSDEPTQ